MFELVYEDSGQEKIYAIEKDEVVIGRSPKADLTVSDFGVSRFHAKLVSSGSQVSVQDLESRNGTKVNDVIISLAQLQSGDRIGLGNFSVQFREAGIVGADHGVELDDRELSEASGTIIRDQRDIEKLLEGGGPSASSPEAAQLDQEASGRLLRMLSQVAKVLISGDRLEGILEKVVDLVFENIPAERGVLGLFEGDELALKVVRYRKEREEGEKITIPRSITNRVRDDKVSILTMDAQQDQRFDASHSILLLGIRSAMCVPLWLGDDVIGIIYVDEDIRAGTFNTNDLDLLSALGNYAAVAIQRTRLNEKIKEEQATREKLARYHSPGVINRILESGASADALEMQELEVTVCFADIVGFTSMSEGLEPRQVGQVINEYFTELTECVFKYEGTLDKYIGDCIMSVFGAPMAQSDHAYRCVSCALEMYEALERLNTERDDGRTLQLRTGINSGNVVAGDIGSPKRKDYSVLGDTVNLASRLESSIAKPGWVVIGEATYEQVKDRFECEYLGSSKVKGKAKEVGAYRVHARKSPADEVVEES